MFKATTKMNKPKLKKAFNLFDGMLSDDDEPPRYPTKNLPRFADTATSSVPSQPYILACTSRVDALQLHRSTTSFVEQQTDATPRETSTPGCDKLGMALYALPDKDFCFKHKNGEMIFIHKNVLAAQSPYFFQQFYGNPGSSIDTVLLDDFDPYVISLAIKAFYHQPIDENALDDRTAEQLYNFAMKYDIGYIKALLPRTSTKNIISADTVCSISLRTYETNDLQLRQKCAAFLACLIAEGMEIPIEIQDLPADFFKAIVLAIAANNKS
uniref:BTB domain-containing protein n=1 Tax=Panagrolaimus sp. PS1159 TaxID=55785 RepID=A0AC35FFF2_9BILA